MGYEEINFDGLVGPTHNFAGLSYGNIASSKNRSRASNPRKAALQGLRKAKALADRGFPQALLPPHERPSLTALRSWGFSGPDEVSILDQAAREAPHLLAAACSASAMWTANACTMTPSCDTRDGRAHFTPANLSGNLHRSIEAGFTEVILKTVFKDPTHFIVHPPLPAAAAMDDEGAANHTRFWHPLSLSPFGMHLFVYGRSALGPRQISPGGFPARQTRESLEALVRHHRIVPGQFLLLQQSPEAIDAGAFHNDVVSVGHQDGFLYHESAFVDTRESIDKLQETFTRLHGHPLRLMPVRSAELSLEEAVKTYLFNSQLLSLSDGSLLLVAPAECRGSPMADNLISQWLQDSAHPVSEVITFDLRESMCNGGGPACLRLRVQLNERERSAIEGRLMLDDNLYADLVAWVERHYRSTLTPADLQDPLLLEESRRALDELTGILGLPPVYPFQIENSSTVPCPG